MKYDFDSLVERRGTDCAKWDSLDCVFGSEDVLPFWIADMDFKSPPQVLDALREKLDHGVLGYPVIPDSLYRAIADWQMTRHGFSVDKSWITWSPGVVAGLSFCVEAFTEPGEEIIVQSPVYPPFYHLIKGNGRRVATNPLKRVEGRYTFDLEHLESMVTPLCRTLILCSPHNPVMRVWTREELAALAELAKRKDILILADEIHQDLVYSDAKHTCFASLSEDAAWRSVTFVSPSKTFNVAGLASSSAIIPNKKLKDKFVRITDAADLNQLNLMGQTAMETAYARCADWADELIAYLEGNRDFVEIFIKERMPKARMDHPEGTYIFWIDFSGYGLSGDALQELLVKKAGVALNDGRTFGVGGDGFARLNIGTSRALLRRGLESIASALEVQI